MKYDDTNLGDECIVMGYPVRLPHMSMAKGIISTERFLSRKKFSI